MRFASIVVLMILSVGCGGGGGGGGGAIPWIPETPSSSWDGPVNEAGYPDVAGKYSFNTDEISFTGTNGEEGVIPPLALSFQLSQTVNQLLAINSAASTIPGFEVIDSNDLTGNIDKSGDFIMNQITVAEMDSILGTSTIHYSITGNFTPTGWDGDYVYTVFNDYYNVTWTYTTTFTGDYLGPLDD